MNDKIKIGDLLVVNESGQVVKYDDYKPLPVLGVAMNDQISIYEDIGVMIRNATGIVNVTLNVDICVVCGKCYHEWQDGDEPDNHPFCKDNLVFLEWKASKKTT